jgi:hypothetical protein
MKNPNHDVLLFNALAESGGLKRRAKAVTYTTASRSMFSMLPDLI